MLPRAVRPRAHPRWRVLPLLLWLACGIAAAMPPEVDAALQRARVPQDAVSVVLQEAGSGRTLLTHNAHVPVNPASLAKLLTTIAALDQLGPAWTWSTPVWLQGGVADGVLDGNLVIKGSGDPKLVVERMWLLLARAAAGRARDSRRHRARPQRVRARHGRFGRFRRRSHPPLQRAARRAAAELQVGDLYLRARYDAGCRLVGVDPVLAGTQVERTVRLSAGPCDDWRTGLKAQFSDAQRVRFAGTYPAACGELAWPVADADPASYNARLIEALWRDMGGKLGGRIVEGLAPAGLKPSFELRSPPLADVVRDINKFSNNVMAQQLFLTLALQRQPGQPASAEAARALLHDWLVARTGELPAGMLVDNGSGLSRDNRMSAALLARLLQQAWSSPAMPELMSSLPVNGLDGTMRRSRATPGRAHLKTGSLRDVAGLAGYVLSDGGRRYVLVAIINHPNANAARPALDALVQWSLRDAPPR